MTTLRCYWITYTDGSEFWDEGVPYPATSPDDAERQMIVNGTGASPDSLLEDLRRHYDFYYLGQDRSPPHYRIELAENYRVNEEGFAEKIEEGQP